MIKLNLESILKHLEKNDFKAKLQKETNQVYVIFKISTFEFPLFFRVTGNGDLLQILVFMPGQIKKEALNDLGRLLHYINKELDIPGFGMDEESSLSYYRYILPAPTKEIDEDLLNSFLKSVQMICESFAPSVVAVANGVATYEKVITEIKKL